MVVWLAKWLFGVGFSGKQVLLAFLLRTGLHYIMFGQKSLKPIFFISSSLPDVPSELFSCLPVV
jgi:hypothetical protein